MLNRIIIMGRLTRDPELRRTQSGTSVTSFTVAVDRDYSDQSGDRQTDFIDCVSWRAGADFVAKYFHKGSMIVVDGRLQSRKWQDRDGNNRTSWEILTDHTYFGESKRSDDSGQSYSREPPAYQASQPAPQENYQQQTFHELPDDDGELPF